jgi:hypothetical protein
MFVTVGRLVHLLFKSQRRILTLLVQPSLEPLLLGIPNCICSIVKTEIAASFGLEEMSSVPLKSVYVLGENPLNL